MAHSVTLILHNHLVHHHTSCHRLPRRLCIPSCLNILGDVGSSAPFNICMFEHYDIITIDADEAGSGGSQWQAASLLETLSSIDFCLDVHLRS